MYFEHYTEVQCDALGCRVGDYEDEPTIFWDITPFSALKTEVVGCFETSVPIYRTRWCHIPEECKTDIRNCKIIKVTYL
jgi:hypothetical protein